METFEVDRVFSGSILELYDAYLVPLIFEPYAAGLGHQLRSISVSRVLEVAAGTGVVTRALARTMPASARIVATDLSEAMIERARSIGTSRDVEWRQADAMHLPFGDASFDAVVCQFGVMFFSDKLKAFSEARRVLRPGGLLVFTVWDGLAENEFAHTITSALESVFPEDPPRFLARTPHGYCDQRNITQDLANVGFCTLPQTETVAARSRAVASRIPAIAYCQGTPLRNEIEARDPSLLGEATDFAAKALAKRFGHGPVDGKIQAHIITVER